ncbi:MAG TPA: ABC transporter substrate-binding protein [Phycisphaerae bacterium]|nr:ABC transporter substrate-binding protein [Phycisphaerae bacterium]
MLLFQFALTEDVALKPKFILRVARTDPNGERTRWEFVVDWRWDSHIGGAPASVKDVMSRLRSATGTLEMQGLDGTEIPRWTASRDAGGRFRLDGNACLPEELAQRLTDAATPTEPPTRPVTITDVLAANVPVPTRSKVSFPQFSYRDAFPEANDEPEIVITKFDEAPMLKDLGSMPADWRKHYPDALPPVAERLPLNPAVTVGPDGVGQYGGVWRRTANSIWNFTRRICYESFTRRDPSGNLQPCLAYKWEVSPDWRQFTFHLRKGHRWSDGAPFTAHDITWVCNTVIGSKYWPMPPDWMQATDGSLLLYEDEAEDWAKLARRIVQQAASPEPSAGRQIRALADERLWGRIQSLADGKGNEDTPAIVTSELNELFRSKGFYNRQAFEGIDFGVERRPLEQIGASRLSKEQMELLLFMTERDDLLRCLNEDPNGLRPIQLNRLNLLLFRASYRDLVPLPKRQRVNVEALPDANGDDSHIVRFTFRYPNSIFLEQSATFMFYRGLFNLPKHTTRKQHPDGAIGLAWTDFWRWEDFWKTVTEQAGRQTPSPGKRLWELLDEPTRQKVLAGRPARRGGESDWQYDKRIGPQMEPTIEAINKALARPGYYEPQLWPNYSAEAAREKLLGGEGFSELARDMAKLREYRDLLVLEDLLKRLQHDGADSLSSEEHLRLNVVMLRAAFSDDTEETLIARTREAGIDRDARREPRRFNTWTRQLYYRTDYHPEANPHHPYLGAWRLVNEKDKPEIMAVRNPYYYRVDAAGKQLPYFDAVRTSVSTQRQVRTLKMRSGNVDYQSSYVEFDDFTVLKQGEKDGNYEVRLWAEEGCGGPTFICLQPHKDPAYRRLQDDPNFRHALSLALNRQDIIDVVYYGLGQPAQQSVPYGSPYYNPNEATAFVDYDPNRANRLLDAMGLDKRARDGTRLLWDGRPLIMDLNMTVDFPVSVARLAINYWRDIGINVQMKIRTGAMLYRLEEMGLCDIRAGVGGGSFFGPMLPSAYYPSHPAEAVQWSQWVSYVRSGGRSGKPAPERIKELDRMWTRLVRSANPAAKARNWKAVTDRFARDLPIIGVTTVPGKVVVVRNGVKNVPRIALAGWIAHEPGNCCPECFYFDRQPGR